MWNWGKLMVPLLHLLIMRPEEETDGPTKKCGFCKCQRRLWESQGWILIYGWTLFPGVYFFGTVSQNIEMWRVRLIMVSGSLDVGFVFRCFWKPHPSKPALCSHGKLSFYIFILETKSVACTWTVMQKDCTSNPIYVCIFTKIEVGHCGSIPSWKFLAA